MVTAAALPFARDVLRDVFGYAAFRGRQAEIVEHLVDGGDALVLMPTGGGKSLCYQIPALVRHAGGRGLTVVVSPLIALMQDQVEALRENGVSAAYLNSTLEADAARALEHAMQGDELVLLYVAPERLNTPRFLARLDALHAQGRLALFAIDEAHCVSQWGHDFRADYLALDVLPGRYPGVPRIALTATADGATRADMIARLKLEEAPVFISSFDRPNIRYRVVEKDEPRAQLLNFLREEHLGDAGIVYCQSRRKVDETAQWLAQAGFNALPYHAGLDAKVRERHQQRFLREDGVVMVATIAFGMGIDKPDVRFVAHLDLPKNIESYYQETGRAGRDGLPADAWMAYGLADVVNQRRMIDESPADESFLRVQRGKLDALLAFAEAHDCRRVRLLRYFDEESTPCGNCDNCLAPPATRDATEAARKALSGVYRFRQQGGPGFGSAHLIDVLRGKVTPKVTQYGHEHLTTFGIGNELSEKEWRRLLRQLLAMGCLQADGEFGTLELTEASRAVLRGEVPVMLRLAPAASLRESAGRAPRRRLAPVDLSAADAALYAALKAWRTGVAREHNVPAYVVFNDATLVELAQQRPTSHAALMDISGVGAKKREAWGDDLLALVAEN